jgi:hypothetical protein
MINLFSKQKFECPRCLGKGEVDRDDIKRLGQELIWKPGKCAYCNGKGRVTAGMKARVREDNAYLTSDIGHKERKRLFLGDEAALQRGKWFDRQVNMFFDKVEYLYLKGKMDAETIADFFLMENATEIPAQEREELIEYIQRVISKKII